MRRDRRHLLILAGLCGLGVVVCSFGGDGLTTKERQLVGTWRRVDAKDDRESGLRVVFAENRNSRVELLNYCSKERKTYIVSAPWRVEDESFFWSRIGSIPPSRTGIRRPLEVLLVLCRHSAGYRGDTGSLEFISRDRIRIDHPEWMLNDAEYQRVTDPSEFRSFQSEWQEHELARRF
jgi:hypothetical protein